MPQDSEEIALIIHVDRGACAGHMRCAARAPDVYEVDEDGFCISDGQRVEPKLAMQARLGARVCPERAITLSPADERG